MSQNGNSAPEDPPRQDDGLDADIKTSAALPTLHGLLRCALVVLLVLTHTLTFMAGYYFALLQGDTRGKSPYDAPLPVPRAEKRLPRQGNDFDEASQANALLSLMVDNPGCKIYVLRFSKGIERYVLQADLSAQVLIREVVMPDGSGWVDQWQGDVLGRLRNGAAGVSFDHMDTGVRLPHHRTVQRVLQSSPP